jgi:hypothetical protein
MTVAWIAGFVPWLYAWRGNRGWSLFHALHWALLGWLAWGYAIAAEGGAEARFVALCLTGAAGVAVLGARRPHVWAWDFVVLGLIAVMVLPLLETWLIGVTSLDGLRRFFLVATLAIAVVNYVPTRLALGAIALGGGCGGLLYESLSGTTGMQTLASAAVLSAPWLAWLGKMLPTPRSPVDRAWLAFRDRYGLVWSQRVREQFNAAAKNHGWPVALGWSGMQRWQEGKTGLDEIEAALKGLLQRFSGPAQ